MKYHFLTASASYYSGNNFKDLLDEENEYQEFVYWHIGTNKRLHKIEKDDECFIYYSNLPDGSSRILMVGTVIESDCNDSGQKLKFNGAEDEKKYAKLKLKPVSLEDNKLFSLEKLRKYYQLIPLEGQFSYLHIYDDNPNHKKLIDDIHNSIKGTKKRLKHINDYFNNNYCMCEFGCKTFIEENGFYYIERHHLVERNLIDKYKDNKDIEMIDDVRNLYNLCLNCHMKIHHIKIDERKKMIQYLYNKRKDFYDNNFKKLRGNKKSLDWLYDIYKCNK